LATDKSSFIRLFKKLKRNIIFPKPVLQFSQKQKFASNINQIYQYPKMATNKQVTFGDLTVAEYPIELGDNPSCSRGAPLTIGWEPQLISTRNLELYEYTRVNRRSGKKLMLPVFKRSALLLKAGYSIEEICAATEQVTVVHKQRAETLKQQNPGGWGRFNKRVATTIKNIVGPVQKSVLPRSA
jgi:hypothetical protein